MSQNKRKVLIKFQVAIVGAMYMFLFMTSVMALVALEFSFLKRLLFDFLVWTIYGFSSTYNFRPWLEKRFEKQTTDTVKAKAE
jgi:hypothetical protein